MKNLSKVLFFILLCLIGIAVTQDGSTEKNESVSEYEYTAMTTSSPNTNAYNIKVATDNKMQLSSQAPIPPPNQKDPTYLNFLYGIIAIGLLIIACLFLYLTRIWRDLYGISKISTPIRRVYKEPKKQLAHV